MPKEIFDHRIIEDHVVYENIETGAFYALTKEDSDIMVIQIHGNSDNDEVINDTGNANVLELVKNNENVWVILDGNPISVQANNIRPVAIQLN